MSKYYFELTLKPAEQFELFLDLLETLTDDAIEEDDGLVIVRSEDELEDLKFGIEEFSRALNINCEIIYEKKREYRLDKRVSKIS